MWRCKECGEEIVLDIEITAFSQTEGWSCPNCNVFAVYKEDIAEEIEEEVECGDVNIAVEK